MPISAGMPESKPAPGTPLSRSWSRFAGLLMVSTLAACGVSRPTPFGIAERMIRERPSRIVEPDHLRVESVSNRPLPKPAMRACTALASVTAGVWRADCPIPEAAVDLELQVEVSGLHQGSLRVTSADPACNRSEAPPSRPERRTPRGDLYRFDLSADALACAGRRIEIRGLAASAARSRLESIAVAPRPPITVAPGEAVQIALKPEWRYGFVTARGADLTWTPAHQEPAILTFGIATTAPGACTAHIEALDPEGAAEELLEIDLASDPTRTWRDFRLALRRPSSSRRALRFRGDCTSPLLWSEPLLLAPSSAKRPPDVLLVSIDTLRADRLGAYGYEKTISPNLDAWSARNAVTFEQAIAQAPWTFPSHVSMLTGRESIGLGAYFGNERFSLHRFAPLAARLARGGYATTAITGGGFVHPRLGFADGFDRYRFWESIAERDSELEKHLEIARSLLDDEGAPHPYFLFFHTFEVHSPNSPREPYFSRQAGAVPAFELRDDPAQRASPENGFVPSAGVLLRNIATGEVSPLSPAQAGLPSQLYDSAVAFTDEHLGGWIARLEAEGKLDNTIVVITSDHGEALGEGDRYGHSLLDEANLRVPLFIRFPDRRGSGLRILSQVRLIDIVPTILAAAEVAGEDFDGVDLAAHIRGSDVADLPAWSYAASNNRGLAWRAGREVKFVFSDGAWPPHSGHVQRFDLRRDPQEVSPDSSSSGEDGARFVRLARQKLGHELVGLHLTLENPAPATLRARMIQGYIGPSTVKRLNPEIRFSWSQVGQLDLELEPRATGEFVILRVPSGGLDLSGELQYSTCDTWVDFHVRVRTSPAGEPQVVRLPSPACAGRNPPPILRLFWRGDPGALASEPDREIHAQVRALGYVP